MTQTQQGLLLQGWWTAHVQRPSGAHCPPCREGQSPPGSAQASGVGGREPRGSKDTVFRKDRTLSEGLKYQLKV